MIKTLILWFFLLINILTFSAYGSTSTSTIEDSRITKQQKEPKYSSVAHAAMYGMIMESSKPSTQRTYQGLHAIQHTMTSQKAKTVKGGVNNVKSPHKKSGSCSYSIKSSFLFMAALKHLIPGLLLVGCFF